ALWLDHKATPSRRRRSRKSTRASTKSAIGSKRFIRVVRNHMKLAGEIAVDAVVTGTRPVPVVVNETVVQREKSQGAVDIENWRECLFELSRRSLAKRLGQINKSCPL